MHPEHPEAKASLSGALGGQLFMGERGRQAGAWLLLLRRPSGIWQERPCSSLFHQHTLCSVTCLRLSASYRG